MSSKPKHTVGVLGVRDLNGELYINSSYVEKQIEAFLRKERLKLEDVAIITGGGRGVEAMVVAWAERHKLPCRKIPPNIQELGPEKAFVARNNHVVAQSDSLIVFWDGLIEMTTEAIATAMYLHRNVLVYPVV